MSEGMIGEIRLFAGNFAPRGWAFCDGQLLSISQNTALFSILGTTYGGDGRVTFALPDMRGRMPLGPRQGPGLTNHDLGEQLGEEAHTLSVAEMPRHRHGVRGRAAAGTSPTLTGNYLAGSSTGDNQFATTSNALLNTDSLSLVGSTQPHNNMPPALALNFIICIEGIYPSRN